MLKRTSKWLAFAALAMLAAFGVTACGSDSKTSTTSDAKGQTVGFLYVGPKNDFGYNQAAYEGSLEVAKNIPGTKLIQAENVPETSEASRVMEKMIKDGATTIFATSYGHLQPMLAVAKKYPNVTFEHQGGVKSGANVGSYFGQIYEAQYLTGMAAGLATKSNKLGYVVAVPIPQTLLNVNAFELGAKSVNPKAKTTVVFTGSWCDPAKQKEAADTLIQGGADVLSQHQDCTKTIVETTEKAGAMSVGYHADASSLAPNGWLTGSVWNWGPLYTDIVKTIGEGKWKGSKYDADYRVGFADSDIIKLAPFGTAVTPEIKKQVLAKQKEMKSKDFYPFEGPVVDQSGKTQIPTGQNPSPTDLEKTDYLVEGVVGKIPTSSK
ncbi:MAG: BMP family ABC transporter substrate-binding protein [Solirubrobacterales bacterium]|nr:BMP family ABC transporter substrate-binding protein [Solirubrobacterales bacterium]